LKKIAILTGFSRYIMRRCVCFFEICGRWGWICSCWAWFCV